MTSVNILSAYPKEGRGLPTQCELIQHLWRAVHLLSKLQILSKPIAETESHRHIYLYVCSCLYMVFTMVFISKVKIWK